MRFNSALPFLTLLAAASLTCGAHAQGGPPEQTPGMRGASDGPPAAAAPAVPDPSKTAVTDDARAVERLAMAARLAASGRLTASPYAIAAAAELYATTVSAETGREKASEGGEAPAADAQPTARPVTDPQALYAEAAAAARAASNEPLAGQIELQAQAAASRQSVPGSGGEHADRVNPHSTDVYRVRFRGGEMAAATAVADPEYDIDLYVYDDAGRLTAYDNDLTSVGVCLWNPPSTGEYTLKVRNTTGSYVTYLIYTN
jgi:hypothetical protein